MNLILFVIAIFLLYFSFKGIMESIKIKKYITGGDTISYHNAIKKIHKSPNHFQPIYEAFVNSWESIRSLDQDESFASQNITIRIYFVSVVSPNAFKKTNDPKFEFYAFEIEDTGIGLIEESYKRLQKLYDEGKGFNNRGSGRIQYLHFFKRSFVKSAYKDGNEFYLRELLLSKIGKFENNNALIGEINKEVISKDNYLRKTLIRFEEPLEEKDFNFYSKLTANSLKDNLIKQFMGLLCLSDFLPKITIEKYEGTQLIESQTIDKSDFPIKDKTLDFSVFYSRLNQSNTELEISNNNEVFTLNTFKIPSDQLDKNRVEITSKGQILNFEKEFFEFPFIKAEDSILNDRYLFLLSSQYFDNSEGDERGKVELMSKKDFLKRSIFYPEEVILVDSIQEKMDETILNAYPEIQDKNSEKLDEINDLKELFLLDDEAFSGVSISINDTAETILKKVYKKQADNIAKSDAIIKNEIDNLKRLDPTKDTYHKDLEKSANIITTQIPLQDRTALTQYIARRGIVLNVFSKALGNNLDIQQNCKRNINEKIIHNILFKQKGNNPEVSDLWMLNEDYVMYSGLSEIEIGNLEYKGQPIIKADHELTDHEKNRIKSLELDRYQNRLDTILFPSEGKCIILEYKNPDALLSKHLSQIQNYATLIYNYSKNDYKIDTFFGYLIGDRFDFDEITTHDPTYETRTSEQGSFIYKKGVVAGYDGRDKGSIYIEILSYDTVLERAKNRNKILFNKIKIDFDKGSD